MPGPQVCPVHHAAGGSERCGFSGYCGHSCYGPSLNSCHCSAGLGSRLGGGLGDELGDLRMEKMVAVALKVFAQLNLN